MQPLKISLLITLLIATLLIATLSGQTNRTSHTVTIDKDGIRSIDLPAGLKLTETIWRRDPDGLARDDVDIACR